MTPAGPAPAGRGNRIFARGFEGPWEALSPLRLPSAAAVAVTDHHEALRAVLSAVGADSELLVASRGRLTGDTATDVRAAGLTVVTLDQGNGGGRNRAPEGAASAPEEHLNLLEPTRERASVAGRIWLLTSGSTGRPKMVAHDLGSLTTVTGEQAPRTWLCPYAHGAYAWWQVVTLSLRHPGQDVLFIEPDELDTWPARALEVGVTAASGTPTFWRQALYRDPDAVAALPLTQITLGGEPVDQAILTRLKEMFPSARVSWIYASSEAGASIAVHDARAGFPESWLETDPDTLEGVTGSAAPPTPSPRPARARLMLDRGELLIASPGAGEGTPPVLRTGDRAEVVDGRVLITGRLGSDEINVGGAKASAAAVRDVLQSHPCVAWASVRARRAPIVGSMVTAEIVLSQPATPAELTAWCAARLPEHAVPRRLRVLDEIPIKESLKSDV